MKNTETTKRNQTPATLAPVQANTTARKPYLITAENVQTLGEIVAVRALEICHQFATKYNITGAPLPDGYDVAQTASAFLREYMGQPLDAPTTDGQKDKDGNPITILRACFSAVNRYIMGERQREYKRAYVEDIDPNGNILTYELPDKRNQTPATASKRNRKQAQPAPAVIADTANPAEIITADNVQTMGERIAVRALKTCYQKGGQPFIYALYCGLVADITENKKTGAPLSDGYDIAQTASAFLCEYIGKTLQDATTDGQTDKDGNPVTILRACFRAVNRYIMGERQHEYKRLYVDEIDEKGNALYYEIPEFWDLPTATDYKTVTAKIAEMKLSMNEKRVLIYRLRGVSLEGIARIIGADRRNVTTYLQRIRTKARKIGLTANA